MHPSYLLLSRLNDSSLIIDRTVSIIESIWPTTAAASASATAGSSNQVIPLRLYVQEILKRSRASFSTLQLANLYLVRFRNRIVESRASFTLKNAEGDASSSTATATTTPTVVAAKSTSFPSTPPLIHGAVQASAGTATPMITSDHACGRRMFLAALIVALKYLQDRNFGNSAWSRISGLPVDLVNRHERRFLEAIGYDLYVGKDTFTTWSLALVGGGGQRKMVPAAAATSTAVLGGGVVSPAVSVKSEDVDAMFPGDVVAGQTVSPVKSSEAAVQTAHQLPTPPLASVQQSLSAVEPLPSLGMFSASAPVDMVKVAAVLRQQEGGRKMANRFLNAGAGVEDMEVDVVKVGGGKRKRGDEDVGIDGKAVCRRGSNGRRVHV
ncbi:hypothetical protein HDU97_008154 [Phlyctochytrium planicorne]|nr:hypothetical protein HDU97_008154 [Phlyctochytrium planicorne]